MSPVISRATFLGDARTLAAICAFGEALGLENAPFEEVVQKWHEASASRNSVPAVS